MLQALSNCWNYVTQRRTQNNDGRIAQLPADLIFAIFECEQITALDLKKFLACKRFVKLMSDSRFRDLFHRKLGKGTGLTWNDPIFIKGQAHWLNNHLIIIGLRPIVVHYEKIYSFSLSSISPAAVDGFMIKASFPSDNEIVIFRNTTIERFLSNLKICKQTRYGFKNIETVLQDNVKGLFVLYMSYKFDKCIEVIDKSLNTVDFWNITATPLFLGLSHTNRNLSVLGLFESGNVYSVRRYTADDPAIVIRSTNFSSNATGASNDHYLAISEQNFVHLYDSITLHEVRTLTLEYPSRISSMNNTHLLTEFGEIIDLTLENPEWKTFGANKDDPDSVQRVMTENYLLEAYGQKIVIYRLRDYLIINTITFPQQSIRFLGFRENHYLLVQREGYIINLWGLKTEFKPPVLPIDNHQNF